MSKIWENFELAIMKHSHILKTNPEMIEANGENEYDFTRGLINTFYASKLFDVDEDLKELLLKTDGTKEINNLPFNQIFIDVKFDVKEFNENQFKSKINDIVGILITTANTSTKVDEEDNFVMNEHDLKNVSTLKGLKGYRIYILAIDCDGGYSFNTINIVDKQDIFNINIKSYTPKIRKFILNFLSNFLNLVNNPRDITIYNKEYNATKNKQRIRKGMRPVPNKRVLIPTGEMKVYIKELKEQINDFSYSHSFWVRGHWRNFKSDKFTNVQNKKTWIYPYIKGKGILINKEYGVK